MRVGDRVRRLREETGWSQEELADRSGVNRVSLSTIETGDSDPRVSTIQKIAAASPKPLQWFFQEDTENAASLPVENVAAALRELEAAQARLTTAQEQLRRALAPAQADRVAEAAVYELAGQRADREKRLADLTGQIRERMAASQWPQGGEVTEAVLAEAARIAAETYLEEDEHEQGR